MKKELNIIEDNQHAFVFGPNSYSIDMKRTPLHQAAMRGDIERIQELIESGANVNAKDLAGWTALHFAAWQETEEMAKLLRKAGADIDAKDTRGWMPLHVAAWNGKKEVSAFLLDSGAAIDARDWNGKTPLDLAKEANKDGSHDKVIALLSK